MMPHYDQDEQLYRHMRGLYRTLSVGTWGHTVVWAGIAAIFAYESWWPLIIFGTHAALYTMSIAVMRRRFFRRTRWTQLFQAWAGTGICAVMVMAIAVLFYRMFAGWVFVTVTTVYGTFIVILIVYYHRRWRREWDAYKKHNETTALDLETGTYNNANGFRHDDEKLRKRSKKTSGVGALLDGLLGRVLPYAAGIGAVIPQVLGVGFDWDNFEAVHPAVYVLCPLLIVFSAFAQKNTVYAFGNRGLLWVYEQRIGRPIINEYRP